VTGAYPVLAICIGGGWTTIKNLGDEKGSLSPVSDVVNKKLRQMLSKEKNPAPGQWRRPYVDVTAARGLEMLLSILSDSQTDHTGISEQSSRKQQSESHESILPLGTRLELAVVEASRRKIIRKRLDEVWGNLTQ